jgi:transcription initiation factor IIE alpha subunit
VCKSRPGRLPRFAEWNDKITARSDSAVWEIADLLLRRPVINTALLTEELGIESKHARRYLEPLSEAGIIIERSSPHSMPLPNARAGAGWDDEGQ